MSGGVFIRFTVGRPGASAAHLGYITRPGALGRDEQAVATRYLPAEAREGADAAERRASLVAYAAEREASERERPPAGGRGASRTHYRLVLSCEGRVSHERMQVLVDHYLARTLPRARTVSVVHQDTDHTHAHVWIDARGVDGRKLHFDGRTYRRLDEAWAREYGREFGPAREWEHLAKKAEMRAWRAATRQARAEGRPAPAAPTRADRRLAAADYRAREARNQTADRGRSGGDQRREVAGDRRRQPAARPLECTAGAVERLGGAHLAVLRALAAEANRPAGADRTLGRGANSPGERDRADIERGR